MYNKNTLVSGMGKEKCQLAFDFYKCVYEDNPEVPIYTLKLFSVL